MTEFEKTYLEESDIIWPSGFVCIGRKTGSLAHGQTWILEDESEEKLKLLEEKKAKLEAGIKFVSQKIQDLEIQLAHKSELSNFSAEDNYLSFDKDEEESDELHAMEDYSSSKAFRNKKKNAANDKNTTSYLNPHDDLNPEAELEEKSRIKIQLEYACEHVAAELTSLRASTFRKWYSKNPIEQVARLDAPWMQFKKEQDHSITDVAPEGNKKKKKPQLYEPEESKDSARIGNGTAQQTSLGTKDTLNRIYCAKLLGADFGKGSDGRFFRGTKGILDSKESLRPLLREGEQLIQLQWNIISKEKNNDFESLCILPLFAVFPIEHSRHESLFEAAFLSPHCKNGSVIDVVSKLAGRRQGYWFKEALILENLKRTIKTMAFLEREGIFHGSIKPSNIYISSDGNNLLVGDFLPRVELRRWLRDLRHGIANLPTYFSPELYKELIIDKRHHVDDIESLYNLHKHDVFCLGLTYYYITCRKLPKKIFQDPAQLKKALKQLREESHDLELINCLTTLLTFDEKKRPTFWESLSFTEKATWVEGTLVDGLKQFLGLT